MWLNRASNRCKSDENICKFCSFFVQHLFTFRILIFFVLFSYFSSIRDIFGRIKPFPLLFRVFHRFLCQLPWAFLIKFPPLYVPLPISSINVCPKTIFTQNTKSPLGIVVCVFVVCLYGLNIIYIYPGCD